MPRSRRRTTASTAIASLVLSLGAALAAPVASSASETDAVPGTRPDTAGGSTSLMATADASTDGLQMVVNERGLISQSTSALGTTSGAGSLRVDKPAGATVRGAWMAYATTGFTGFQVVPGAELTLAGKPVPISNELRNGISSYNYFAEVTDIVKPVVDEASAGSVSLPVTEPYPSQVDGEILVVVFDDPAITQPQSVTLMYGALAPGGDSYRVRLASPIDLADPATRLQMSLGITYSYQSFGTQQYSYVNVNGNPLTSAAGGEDDGQAANGALVTVGGLGDSPTNPSDPAARPTEPRSDDELYDLAPFVKDGDQVLEVSTSNPSFDDNVMLATFTMNPPVTDIDSGRELVMVSLGDSYQSGEGAGSAYDDASAYYLNAYENGENYPQAVGGQEDTLTPEASGGNGCHRALRNYPKLVSGYLSADYDVTLVDVTCSGAKIERGGKPPLVGDVLGGVIEPDSQVANALGRLATIGLTADDVDLVTVGMGGNDARFADLVTACLAPTLARRLLDAYDRTPGELSWAAKLLTCERLDDHVFHASDAIDTLAAKERFAQTKLREAFPNADIFQADYPGVLPDPDQAPSWCGGIGAGDIEYADTQAQRINDVIRDTVAQAHDDSAALDRYYALIEVQSAFGANALCPQDSSAALANGISEENFDKEVDRLLADPVIRPQLDEIVDAYASWRNCMARLGLFCDPQARTDRLTQAVQALVATIQADQAFFDNVLANITKPPDSGESVEARLDRSRGLFHPNQAGIDILACFVHGAVTFLGTLGCGPGTNGFAAFSTTSTATDALTATLVPVPVAGAGAEVPLHLTGYAPGSGVTVTHDGSQVATLTAGADGVVTGPLTLPAAQPGVQLLEVRGSTATGAWIGHDLRLTYPGSPQLGQDYTFHVDGFEKRPAYIESTWTPEKVTITYAGIPLPSQSVDREGGLLLTVPIPDNWPDGPLEVVVTGQRSGVERRVRLDADNTADATGLWALTGDLRMSGARAAVELLTHGEKDVRLMGADSRFDGGVEYVGDLDVAPNVDIDPAPLKVPEGGKTPRVLAVSAFRPGGPAAVAAGADYRDVPASACVDGTWTATAADLYGVIHVPCSVLVTGSGTDVAVTLAAEGRVTIESAGLGLAPAGSGAVVVAGDSVHVAADDVTLGGSVFSARGVQFSGARQTLLCGAVGASVRVSGADFAVRAGGPCAPR